MIKSFPPRDRANYDKIMKYLANCGQIKIDDFGNLDFIFNDFNGVFACGTLHVELVVLVLM